MKIKVIFLLILSGLIYGQTKNDQLVLEEKSVFWKQGKDKLILEDGNFYYGEYIKRSGKKITFKREYDILPEKYFIKDIKLLALTNGKIIVRDRLTFRPLCYFIFIYTVYYFSLI